MRFVDRLVKVSMIVIMGMQMHMVVAVRAMRVPMGMKEFADDATIALVHLRLLENIVEEFMGHQRQR